MKKPVKPRTKAPSTAYHAKPLEELHEGQLFRVRDKDWETVHGEGLTYQDAHKLKERVAAKGHRTARIESMEYEPPDWYVQQLAQFAAENGQAVAAGNKPVDPQLEQLRARARQVSAQSAGAAQVRHQQAAARDRSAPAAAKKVARPTLVPGPVPTVPVVSTVLAEDDDLEIDPNVDPDELGSMVAEGGKDDPSADDLKRAKAQRDKDIAAAEVKLPPATAQLTARAKELYEREIALKGGGQPFDKLHEKTQGWWRIEAQKNPVDPAEEPVAANGVAETVADQPSV